MTHEVFSIIFLTIVYWFQWQERCKNLTATMAKTSVVELPGTNNIHSGTSLNDEGSSLALGSRQSFSHVASVHDVQPLTVLTVGRTQNSLSTHNEVSSAATETGSLRRHSVSDRTETLVDFANEWAGVSGNSVHYMDSAKFLVPTNFGLGMLSPSQCVLGERFHYIRDFEDKSRLNMYWECT